MDLWNYLAARDRPVSAPRAASADSDDAVRSLGVQRVPLPAKSEAMVQSWKNQTQNPPAIFLNSWTDPVPEPALARVKAGQTVESRVEALPVQIFTGKLNWIGAEVDERSRMAQARVEVPNTNELLKAKMFAKARILARSAEGAVLVPSSALYAVEGKTFVFVKVADDLFEARAVSLGVKFEGKLEVLAGLKPQELVVVNHGFALKSQWLSSRMGAGCAD